MNDFAFPEISNSRHLCGILVYNHLQNLDNSKPSEYLWEALEWGIVDKRRQNYYYSGAGTILCR